MFNGWRGAAAFAVSVLMMESGTAVGSPTDRESVFSGLFLSVNTAYLACIVVVLPFVLYLSVNPEIVATSPPSLWSPPDRGLLAAPLHLQEVNHLWVTSPHQDRKD